jgi:hypothetical protein
MSKKPKAMGAAIKAGVKRNVAAAGNEGSSENSKQQDEQEK